VPTTATTHPEHDSRACDGALRRAFTFLGKRWNGVLIATLINGAAGFADLKRAVEGISDSMLSDRLAELTAAGLVARDVEPGPPVAVTYRLTASGMALVPAMEALTSWASQNLPAECAGADGNEPPVP
jgi:DNA-binding HxlR family transcriptional regulator